jgi:hypothetical protein
LFPDQFGKLIAELRLIARAIDRTVAPSPGTAPIEVG